MQARRVAWAVLLPLLCAVGVFGGAVGEELCTALINLVDDAPTTDGIVAPSLQALDWVATKCTATNNQVDFVSPWASTVLRFPIFDNLGEVIESTQEQHQMHGKVDAAGNVLLVEVSMRFNVTIKAGTLGAQSASSVSIVVSKTFQPTTADVSVELVSLMHLPWHGQLTTTASSSQSGRSLVLQDLDLFDGKDFALLVQDPAANPARTNELVSLRVTQQFVSNLPARFDALDALPSSFSQASMRLAFDVASNVAFPSTSNTVQGVMVRDDGSGSLTPDSASGVLFQTVASSCAGSTCNQVVVRSITKSLVARAVPLCVDVRPVVSTFVSETTIDLFATNQTIYPRSFSAVTSGLFECYTTAGAQSPAGHVSFFARVTSPSADNWPANAILDFLNDPKPPIAMAQSISLSVDAFMRGVVTTGSRTLSVTTANLFSSQNGGVLVCDTPLTTSDDDIGTVSQVFNDTATVLTAHAPHMQGHVLTALLDGKTPSQLVASYSATTHHPTFAGFFQWHSIHSSEGSQVFFGSTPDSHGSCGPASSPLQFAWSLSAGRAVSGSSQVDSLAAAPINSFLSALGDAVQKADKSTTNTTIPTLNDAVSQQTTLAVQLVGQVEVDISYRAGGNSSISVQATGPVYAYAQLGATINFNETALFDQLVTTVDLFDQITLSAHARLGTSTHTSSTKVMLDLCSGASLSEAALVWDTELDPSAFVSGLASIGDDLSKLMQTNKNMRSIALDLNEISTEMSWTELVSTISDSLKSLGTGSQSAFDMNTHVDSVISSNSQPFNVLSMCAVAEKKSTVSWTVTLRGNFVRLVSLDNAASQWQWVADTSRLRMPLRLQTVFQFSLDSAGPWTIDSFSLSGRSHHSGWTVPVVYGMQSVTIASGAADLLVDLPLIAVSNRKALSATSMNVSMTWCPSLPPISRSI